MNANPAADIVLVHGGFVDGSGRRAVCDLFTRDGYHVTVVQNPTLSLQGDTAAARLTDPSHHAETDRRIPLDEDRPRRCP